MVIAAAEPNPCTAVAGKTSALRSEVCDWWKNVAFDQAPAARAAVPAMTSPIPVGDVVL